MISIIAQQEKKRKRIAPTPPSPFPNNQLEEIDYFNAYLLPVSEKVNIQSALNTYGSIRLNKGDYRGVNISIGSNQKIYGSSAGSWVSNITIAGGSTNVLLQDLKMNDSNLTFSMGGSINNCIFKSIKEANALILNGGILENNLIINCDSPIRFDCSASGYFRNNKIIKHQVGSVSNQLVLKGNTNSATRSYGNVFLHCNYRTSRGDTSDLLNLVDATFVGIDAESWNFNNEGSKAMFYAQNIGRLKITDFGGGNGGSPFKTPSFDVDANDLLFLDKYNNYPTDVVSLKTNMFLVNGVGTYTRKLGTVTGYDLLANLEYSNTIIYNGSEQLAPISDSTTLNRLRTSILDTQHTPWLKPSWEELPNPTGDNWQTNRIGKPDSRAYIQGLIDSNNIAELPEGIYYIGSTLIMPMDGNHGIKGSGTGKTAIVGLTDNFPLISLSTGADGSFTLSNLTLQGGSVGVYASTDYGYLNIAYQNMKFVVFRDMQYGIHIKRTGGFDNNFLENLGFINCEIGFYQEPTPGDSGEMYSAYVDKTMFYNNQYLNCSTGLSMLATRADNLNSWVDCKFNTGNVALNITNNNYPIIANSEFSGYTGTNVIRSNSISMYNTEVKNNAITESTLLTSYSNIEGCSFLDNSKMFSPMLFTSLHNHILNSTVTGNVLASPPSTGGYGKESAIYVNSILSANPTLSKLLTRVKEGVPVVVINETPTPYPQLLVTQ